MFIIVGLAGKWPLTFTLEINKDLAKDICLCVCVIECVRLPREAGQESELELHHFSHLNGISYLETEKAKKEKGEKI